MNVKDFCAMVGAELNMPRDKVRAVFRQIFSTATEILREGDEVRIPEFGRFYPVVLEAKQHVNRFKLNEGEEVITDLPERKKVKFEPYDTLHLHVNRASTEPPLDGLPYR